MLKKLITLLLSIFIISGCSETQKKSNSSSSNSSRMNTNSESTKKYKNVMGGSSQHLSTCKTCGTSYTVKTLPYGQYCSKSCYDVYN